MESGQTFILCQRISNLVSKWLRKMYTNRHFHIYNSRDNYEYVFYVCVLGPLRMSPHNITETRAFSSFNSDELFNSFVSLLNNAFNYNCFNIDIFLNLRIIFDFLNHFLLRLYKITPILIIL